MFALMVEVMGRSMSLSLLRKVVDYYCYHYFRVNASTLSRTLRDGHAVRNVMRVYVFDPKPQTPWSLNFVIVLETELLCQQKTLRGDTRGLRKP